MGGCIQKLTNLKTGIIAATDCEQQQERAKVTRGSTFARLSSLFIHIEANLRKQKYNSNKFGSFMESHYLSSINGEQIAPLR
jgi:hypothetical protein